MLKQQYLVVVAVVSADAVAEVAAAAEVAVVDVDDAIAWADTVVEGAAVAGIAEAFLFSQVVM